MVGGGVWRWRGWWHRRGIRSSSSCTSARRTMQRTRSRCSRRCNIGVAPASRGIVLIAVAVIAGRAAEALVATWAVAGGAERVQNGDWVLRYCFRTYSLQVKEGLGGIVVVGLVVGGVVVPGAGGLLLPPPPPEYGRQPRSPVVRSLTQYFPGAHYIAAPSPTALACSQHVRFGVAPAQQLNYTIAIATAVSTLAALDATRTADAGRNINTTGTLAAEVVVRAASSPTDDVHPWSRTGLTAEEIAATERTDYRAASFAVDGGSDDILVIDSPDLTVVELHPHRTADDVGKENK